MKINRIYQGRILRVDQDSNRAWVPIEDWEEVVWRHHELFQDAVNYYLVCLLSLAGEDNPLRPIRDRISGEDQRYAIWAPFRRRGTTRPGLRDSVAQYLTPGLKEPSLEDCLKAALQGNESTPEILNEALKELLDVCKGEGDIQKRGRELLPMFCVPGAKVTFPYSHLKRDRSKGREELPGLIHDPSSEKDMKALLKQLKYEWFATPSGRVLEGEKAKALLRKSLEFFVKESYRGVSSNEGRLKRAIDRLENLRILSLRGGSINNKVLKSRFYAYLLFAYVEQSHFTLRILRKVIPPPDSGKKKGKKKAGDSSEKAIPSFDFDPIEKARGRRGYVFRAFTSLPAWNPEDSPEPRWKEFDIAAFKEALKTIHQIEAVGKDRQQQRDQLKRRHDFMVGRSKKWEGVEEEDKPPVLEGDPRIERLREILSGDLAAEYEMSEGQKVDYGLRPRTIRGFSELRREWRKIAGPGIPYSEGIGKRLKECLREYQRDHPEVIGSVRLFEELLQPENWIVWQEQELDVAKLWAEKGFADEPLKAFSDERELNEDIHRLGEPVRLVPAHPVYSPRLFYFPRGEFKHEPNSRSVIVPLAMIRDGAWRKTRIRINYGAPRLFRDKIRRDRDEDLAKADWAPPLREALEGGLELPQDVRKAAVALMPKRLISGQRRFLLNFPLTLDVDPLRARIGKASRWKDQFAGTKDHWCYLRWPKDRWPSAPDLKRWYQSPHPFTCLAVDLGQRNAAAFAILEAKPGRGGKEAGRRIGEAEGRTWRACVGSVGLLRLPGEDARVLRRGETAEEYYGDRGRRSSESEWLQARSICKDLFLDPDEILGGDPGKWSFPECNDKLLYDALRRAQSRLARLQRWSWRAKDPKYSEKTRSEILESEEDPFSLVGLVRSAGLEGVSARIVSEIIPDYRARIARNLVAVANRILPLRGRRWEWIPRVDGSGCHVLRQTDPGTDTRAKKLMGQRGLSLKRIEQLEELRRRCQSLNRAVMQVPGSPPVLGRSARGLELPDPCPDVLEKLQEIREQRINQTAHLILAEALGLRLRQHRPEDRQERVSRDVHGEYERIPGREPVDFVVLEDLSRYLSSQGRSRRENSRLMKWCHRSIRDKLKELCEPYGIPVLEATAGWSSRFSSRDGMPGFRAVELNPADREDSLWRKHFNRLAAEERGERKLDPEERDESLNVKRLFEDLERANGELLRDRPARPRWRTLLAPHPGGPLFVPIRGGSVIQADINAAVNIGLRAIAAPDCHDVHVRIRSQREGEVWRVRRESAREKARWGDPPPGIVFDSPEDSKILATERNPIFFADPHGIAQFDRARVDGIRVASSRGLWGTVRRLAWSRIGELNRARLEKWRPDPRSSHPEGVST